MKSVNEIWIMVLRVQLKFGCGWRRVGPWRSGRACSRVCGAATAKRPEHVRVTRRQDPLLELGDPPDRPYEDGRDKSRPLHRMKKGDRHAKTRASPLDLAFFQAGANQP